MFKPFKPASTFDGRFFSKKCLCTHTSMMVLVSGKYRFRSIFIASICIHSPTLTRKMLSIGNEIVSANGKMSGKWNANKKKYEIKINKRNIHNERRKKISMSWKKTRNQIIKTLFIAGVRLSFIYVQGKKSTETTAKTTVWVIQFLLNWYAGAFFSILELLSSVPNKTVARIEAAKTSENL